MSQTLFAIILIGHAIAHAGLTSAPNPSDPESTPGAFFTEKKRSWLFQRIDLDSGMVQKIGKILVNISIAGFFLAGLGGLSVPGLNQIWHGLAGITAIVSLILLILFWHPWLILGVVLNIGLVIFMLLNSWPV
jgi:hypothetical protein